MSTPRLDTAAATYEVTVAGHLDDHWSVWLGSTVLVRNDDGSTTLTVANVDQAQLHGVLAGIRDLGVDLLSLHSVPTASDCEQSSSPMLERPLRTRRLTLRPATPNDAEATWAYRHLASANEWLTGVPATFDEYRSTFAEPARLAATVIVERGADVGARVIGDFMLRIEDAWSQVEVADSAKGAQAELGWVLDPTQTGLGYATEAVRELLRYCFDERSIHRVVATCFLANESSWRLMERVGMRRETHAVDESLHRSGQWLDTVGYAVLHDEWHRSTASAHHETEEST